MSLARAFADARRLQLARQAHDLAPVILLIGDPEATKLGHDLTSERQAIIANELIEAEAQESTKQFHARLCRVARERGVTVVSVGSDEVVKISRYDADGNLRVLH
jgi:hypothetical protein